MECGLCVRTNGSAIAAHLVRALAIPTHRFSASVNWKRSRFLKEKTQITKGNCDG